MNERSPKSWVLPLFMAAICGLLTIQFGPSWSDWLAGVVSFSALIFGCWGFIELLMYALDFGIAKWRDIQSTLYHNGPAGWAEAIANLRPDQIRMLQLMTSGAWAVRLRRQGEAPGAKYTLAPTLVPMEFVKYVVEHSDRNGLYPQNRFNDQVYNFDPIFRQYTDRAYYRMLQDWLHINGIIEWPNGNQGAKWRAGWTPELLTTELDLDAFTYEERAKPAALDMRQEVAAD